MGQTPQLPRTAVREWLDGQVISGYADVLIGPGSLQIPGVQP
jgi:hypothetical protein